MDSIKFKNLYNKCLELYKDSHYFNVIDKQFIVQAFYQELSDIIEHESNEYHTFISHEKDDKLIDTKLDELHDNRREMIWIFIRKHFIHRTKYLNLSNAQVQEMHPVYSNLVEELDEVVVDELPKYDIEREMKIKQIFEKLNKSKLRRYASWMINDMENYPDFVTFLSRYLDDETINKLLNDPNDAEEIQEIGEIGYDYYNHIHIGNPGYEWINEFTDSHHIDDESQQDESDEDESQ